MQNPNIPVSPPRRRTYKGDPVPPFGYYSMARMNLEGARRIDLTHNGDVRRNTDTCLQFLFGWCAEGYLKAYLAGQGVTPSLLLDIGHDLARALKEALTLGLDRYRPDWNRESPFRNGVDV